MAELFPNSRLHLALALVLLAATLAVVFVPS